MRRTMTFATLAGAGGGLAARWLPAAAGADQFPGTPGPGGNASVFVQTNDPTGNQIVSYQQTARGGLRQVGRTDTGVSASLSEERRWTISPRRAA